MEQTEGEWRRQRRNKMTYPDMTMKDTDTSTDEIISCVQNRHIWKAFYT